MSKRSKPKSDKPSRGVKRGRGGIAIQGAPEKDIAKFSLQDWLEETLDSILFGAQAFSQNFELLDSAADRCCAYFDGMERGDDVTKQPWPVDGIERPDTLPEAATTINGRIKEILLQTLTAQMHLAHKLRDLQYHIFGNSEDLSCIDDTLRAFRESRELPPVGGTPKTLPRVAMGKLLDAAGAGAVDFEPEVENDGYATNHS